MQLEAAVLDLPDVVAPNSRCQPVSFELAGDHLVLPIKTGRHDSSMVFIDISSQVLHIQLLNSDGTAADHSSNLGFSGSKLTTQGT